MDRATADEALQTAELVPALEGPVLAARELERRLLEADIPVALVKPEAKACCGAGGCGCGSKLSLMVREADVPKVHALLNAEWLEAVRREGTVDEASLVPLKVGEGGEPACPACGHAGPLVEGACGDCGLVLE